MSEYLDFYKIALIQMDCTFMNIPANIEKAENLIRQASDNGANLICLPEAFHVGYRNDHILEMIKYAEYLDGVTLTRMAILAKKLRVFLLVPILFVISKNVENAAFLINDEGNIVGRYSKTHLIGQEQKYFQRGNKYPVFDTKVGKIGILICYDLCFPETIRILALSGAEVVLVPAAWRASYYFKEWWDITLSCRALDNLLYVAAVNCCGLSGEERFAGKSKICSPIGKVLGMCGIEEEEILYGTIDLCRIKKEREFNTVLFDRHPEDYRMLWMI